MLTIHDLELKRQFIGGEYRNFKFVTTADVRIGSSYSSKARVTLSDEQTAKAVDFILGLIREEMTVELEQPEPIVEAPVDPEPRVIAPDEELAPL